MFQQEKFFRSIGSGGKPLPESGGHAVFRCLRDGLRLEPDQSCLASLLKETGEQVRRQSFSRTADEVKVSAWASVNEQTAWNVDLEQSAIPSSRVG